MTQAPPAFPPDPAGRHGRHSVPCGTTVALRLLATSDLHMQVMPYDYHADHPDAGHSLARTATLIHAARAEVANCLLLDNGDFLQGNPMGDLYARPGQLAPGQLHPAIVAMNALGYDAGTLGNHEFNYGLDFLAQVLDGATFPLVSANVLTLAGAPLRPPYTLCDRVLRDAAGRAHPLRIGIIGFAPPQIRLWDRAHLEGRVTTRDIVDSAAFWVPQMRAAGCDLIVALSHSGIGPAQAVQGMENASTALAALPGIDVVIAGHSHLAFPGPGFAPQPGVDAAGGRLSGKPAVMPGSCGSHLGVVDLQLVRGAAGWQVAQAQARLRPVRQGPDVMAAPDAGLVARLAPYHAATLAYARSPVGHTKAALDSFFALVAPSAALALVADAQAQHVAGQLRGTPEAALPLLSAVAPFKTGGRGGPGNYTDVPAGDVALRHAADLYIYPNTVAAVVLTGAEVTDWLERAAGIFRRIRPGHPDQPLLEPAMPGYHFDVIHGLTFAIDLAQPARHDAQGQLVRPDARRITDLRYHGEAVAPEARFVVATNSYRAAGTGGFATVPPVLCGTTGIRDILLGHIAGNSPLPARVAAFWRFAPLPGASVTFDTSPVARGRLGAVPQLALTDLGTTEDGFARFRLAL